MSHARAIIHLQNIADNWRTLRALHPSAEAAAVVKANGYGHGAKQVAQTLQDAGCQSFFVATPEEGLSLRDTIGESSEIFVLNGASESELPDVLQKQLTPVLSSLQQVNSYLASRAKYNRSTCLHFDTGMNRLGMEWDEWAAIAQTALAQKPTLVMSHLACADEPDHPMNAYQLDVFHQMTDGISTPRSLSATGGILMGKDYHFDLTRPGIGLYGGEPFGTAQKVVRMDLPVIQIRQLEEGEVVGYGNTWQCTRPSDIATVSAGYADGLIRAMSDKATLWFDDIPCPVVGRVSMDLITVDVTDLKETPHALTMLGPHQTVDELARTAGTIGYEILTSLGPRYTRRYQTR